jgi:iron donor protein CyaY
MLDEQQFRLKADQTLERLHRALVQASEEFDFETDFAGALTVEFEAPPAKFVISPNAPVRQIWVSAHLRSSKLDWDPAKETFVIPDTGQTLTEVVSDAVGRRLGRNVALQG